MRAWWRGGSGRLPATRISHARDIGCVGRPFRPPWVSKNRALPLPSGDTFPPLARGREGGQPDCELRPDPVQRNAFWGWAGFTHRP